MKVCQTFDEWYYFNGDFMVSKMVEEFLVTLVNGYYATRVFIEACVENQCSGLYTSKD